MFTPYDILGYIQNEYLPYFTSSEESQYGNWDSDIHSTADEMYHTIGHIRLRQIRSNGGIVILSQIVYCVCSVNSKRDFNYDINKFVVFNTDTFQINIAKDVSSGNRRLLN